MTVGPRTPVLHIHCGDCAARVARAAALPGDVLAWKDSGAVGPCAVDRETHRRLRARWWNVAVDEIERAEDLPADRELVLWFGPDPWEQLALVEMLATAPGTALSLVVLDRGVGVMRPEALPRAFAARLDARGLPALGIRLWRDFCADDRAALHGWIERARNEPRLPHLPAALARVLEDRETERTRLSVQSLMAEGVTDVPALMRRLEAMEAPQHGAWYGDAVVRRLRDALVPNP